MPDKPLQDKQARVERLRLLGRVTSRGDGQALETLNSTTLLDVVELSIANKVLLLLCDNVRLDNAPPAALRGICSEQFRRKKQCYAILTSLSKLAGATNIDILIIKTIRPFPYVGSDIDVIVASTEAFARFVDLLVASGYHILGRSAHEVTLQAPFEGIVLVDVHCDISAAGMVYLDKAVLWNGTATVDLDGHSVRVPGPEAELLLLAAHSVFKELSVTLADFLQAQYLAAHVDWRTVHSMARAEHLTLALCAFMSAMDNINLLLYNASLDYPELSLQSHLIDRDRLRALVTRDFCNKLRLPYRFSTWIVAAAYVNKYQSTPTEVLNFSVGRHAASTLKHHFLGKGD